MKQQLGTIKRGLVGIFQNIFEKMPALPALAPVSIGKTVKGHSIDAFIFGKGKKKILLVGSIHGNEVGTHKLMYQLISFLVTQPSLFPNLEIHIIPRLNVDGSTKAGDHPDYFHHGMVGRFNANGVDLNRNFDTKHFRSTSGRGFGKDYSQTETVFAGESPASEPETKALCAYIKNTQIDTYFAFHSAGKDVMANNRPGALALANCFADNTGFRIVTADAGYENLYSGTAKEWCDENDLDYVEIEATNRWGSDWKNQKPGIIACFELLNSNISDK